MADAREDYAREAQEAKKYADMEWESAFFGNLMRRYARIAAAVYEERATWVYGQPGHAWTVPGVLDRIIASGLEQARAEAAAGGVALAAATALRADARAGLPQKEGETHRG